MEYKRRLLLPTSYFLLPTSYFLLPTSYSLPDFHRGIAEKNPGAAHVEAVIIHGRGALGLAAGIADRNRGIAVEQRKHLLAHLMLRARDRQT